MSGKENYLDISGDYQHRAIHEGIFIQRIWHLNKIFLVEEKLDISQNDRVLEIGCGSGNLALWMALKAKRVTGIDISKDSIEFAKKQCEELENADFKIASIEEMELTDDSCDIAVCEEVVEHLLNEEIDTLFSKTFNALRPGGRFLLTTPNYSSLWPVIERLMDLFKLSPQMAGHQHLTKFNMDKLKNWLKSFRFKIIDCGGFNTVSPWVGFLKEETLKKINRFELDHIGSLGNLIYVIAQKPID